MPEWRGWWSTSAATSGFRVRPSHFLRAWRYGLACAWLAAVLAAPLPTLAASFPVLAARLLRGRLPGLPRILDARRIHLDPSMGQVRVEESRGAAGTWTLCRWLRHPWLVILYLEGRGGERACVVLPRDCLDAGSRRRLYYLLGVSTVGAGSGAGSG